MEEQLEAIRESIPLFKYHWENSLRLLGNISHRGTISPEAITRVSVVDYPPLLLQVIDPSITVMNAAMFGERYEALTEALMGYDAPDLEEHFPDGVVDLFRTDDMYEVVEP